MEIDADLSDLVFETSHVVSLINPANTYMVILNLLDLKFTIFILSCIYISSYFRLI